MAKPTKPWAGENRMKVRTYGVEPVGTWQQVAPQRIACVTVTPGYGPAHPSGAPAGEFEIVYEMSEPQEPGGRHSLVLDVGQAYRLAALLTAAWASTGSSRPALDPGEPVTVGETVRIAASASTGRRPRGPRGS